MALAEETKVQKQTEHNQHFSASHLGLIFLVSVLVLSAVAFKQGFDFSFLKKQPSKNKKAFTYEDAKAKAVADLAGNKNKQPGSELEAQLALLDADYKSGQVLGAATNTLDTVFDETATPIPAEILNSIPVLINEKNNLEGITKYISDFNDAEMEFDAIGILVALNSQEGSQVKEAHRKAEELCKVLLRIEVPSELANYHKLKMLYYVELGQLALSYANEPGAQAADSISEQIFSISNELNKEHDRIYKKFGVSI
ncbi:MAG: hypothetical protein JNN11_04525 [Candidatus Doudnabacteria bacterium]|nr:hypothetical protein [Candidatus Doudnabacteria bacterium]